MGRGAPTPHTWHSQVGGGPQLRGCQVLSHWIMLLHDCHLREPSCGSAFLTGPRSHQGYFGTNLQEKCERITTKNKFGQLESRSKCWKKHKKTARSQKSGGWQTPLPLEKCWHLIADWIQGSGRYFCTFKTQGVDSSQAGTWSSEMAWTN